MICHAPPPNRISPNRISPETEQQILSLTTNSRHGSHTIASIAGVSQTTVLRVWRRHNINRAALAARNALVEEHRALAHRIAKSVVSGLPLHMREDLIPVADVALIDAAERFDPTRGMTFPAYVQVWVRQRCIDSIRRRHYTNENGTELPQEAAESRVDEAPDAEALALAAEMSKATRALALDVLGRLTGRQAVLVWLHYIEGQTLEMIAPKFGVVPSRVSQLHREAIAKLRQEAAA